MSKGKSSKRFKVINDRPSKRTLGLGRSLTLANSKRRLK